MLDDQATLHQCRRELTPKDITMPQQLTDPNGTVARTRNQVRTMGQSFFSDRLAAHLATFSDLLVSTVESQSNAFVKLTEHGLISIDEIPSPKDVLQLCKSSPVGRGHGEDALPGEFIVLTAEAATKHLHPLFLKCTFRIQEPVQFKGGMLSELLKGLGNPAKCVSYREILVSDTLGKRYHAWLRRVSLKTCDKVARPTQHAGSVGKGTDLLWSHV